MYRAGLPQHASSRIKPRRIGTSRRESDLPRLGITGRDFWGLQEEAGVVEMRPSKPLAGKMAMDWSGCPIVVSRPGYISGAPALRDDPRVPADLVVENMDLGESAQDVVDNYQLRTPPADVLAVYEYAELQRALSPAR
jgi:uncharacterized protein (DUF433 family)